MSVMMACGLCRVTIGSVRLGRNFQQEKVSQTRHREEYETYLDVRVGVVVETAEVVRADRLWAIPLDLLHA